MTEVQTNPVEEKAPNPYNAKKSWHTPDNPKMESADGLFYAPSQEQQATPSEEESEKPPAKTQTETLRQQLSALQEREADILKREAETMLRERHPDFEDIRGDDAFHEWAKEQPEAIQQWIYANNSDGTLASRAIDLYKMERGIVQPPQKRQSKTKEQRSAADMVSTKTTAVDSKAPKVWTEKEIASMSIDQFDRYESEIKLALSEGRIAK